jgi:hypothetical protein
MLIATLALAAAQPAPEQPVGDEIVVISRKLESWRGSWRLRDGAVTCKTRRSTGDKAIDAVGCDAMVSCIGPLAPRFAEIEASKADKAEMQRQADAMLEGARIGECLTARREAGIAALAEARRSERS